MIDKVRSFRLYTRTYPQLHISHMHWAVCDVSTCLVLMVLNCSSLTVFRLVMSSRSVVVIVRSTTSSVVVYLYVVSSMYFCKTRPASHKQCHAKAAIRKTCRRERKRTCVHNTQKIYSDDMKRKQSC